MSVRASGSVKVLHETGLHARPAVKFTQLAKKFVSRISLALSADGPWIDAKSIVKVLRTKTPKNAILHLRAEGADAEAAIQALIALIEQNFDDLAKGER